MSRFVRASKVRHLYCQPDKKEEHNTHLSLATTTGDQTYIKGNGKFWATSYRAGGGGSLAVIPHSRKGKMPTNFPKITGHSAAIFDFDFNPFHEQIIASGSDDCTCKVWGIPSENGLEADLHDPLFTAESHMRKVIFVKFHPTASNVLATASADQTVKLWDIDAGAEKLTLAGHEQTLQDMQFNYDGSMIATSCKDKKLRLYDPRQPDPIAVVQPHEGSKCFKTCFLGKSGMGNNTGNVVTVGFTRQSKRQFRIWDPRNMDTQIHTQDIDQAAGVIMPYYDEDTHVLFLAGKGDGNIRFYEMVPDKPHTFSLSEYRSSSSQKGICFLPKRHCNIMGCEVARALKLTSNSVEGLSFIIPRKSDRFQSDIFPDTYAGVASQTADEFFAGGNADPTLVSLNPSSASAASETKSADPNLLKSKAQLCRELAAAQARITELEAKLAGN